MWVFLVALIVGGFIGALILWLRSRDIKVSWYEWLIGIAGLLLLLFTVQNYIGAKAEFMFEAGNKFLMVLGIPAVLLMVVAFVLAWRHNRTEA